MTFRRYALRGSAILTLMLLSAFLTAPVLAAGQPTAISLGAPSTTQLGQQVTLQARLVNAAGQPVVKAQVYFVSPATFLDTSGNVVIASAVTDKTGLASATWQVRRNGTLSILAQFRGNDQFAPSQATAQMIVSGSQQLYVQQAGVQIPGLNKAPTSALSGLWPRLSGWPLATVLLIVWSLYGVTVFLIFRIALSEPITSNPQQATAQGETR